jgi:o-succinylbenzoate---CoA ligase
MYEDDSMWITSSLGSIQFHDIELAFKRLKQAPKQGQSLYFTSKLELEVFPLLIAAWLKGYSLVPISDKLPLPLKDRLIKATHAIPLTEQFNHIDISDFIPSIDENRIVCYIQTSGSSGLPKIVGITQKMISAANSTVATWIKPQKQETWLITLPLHHIGGLSIVFRSWLNGFKLHYSADLDLKSISELIESGSIQFVSLVPTQLKRILENGTQPHPLFKKILLGGGPCSIKILQDAVNAGFTVVNSFGMTETAAQFTGKEYTPGELIRSVEVGKCVKPNEIKISRENEENSLVAEGLVWVKGPQVNTKYPFYKSDSDFSEGWFCTGDYGRITENGNLEILMRRTDRIVSGGENINPNEIELLLNDFDSIQDCACLGIDDEEWGQKVVLLFVGNAADLSIKSYLIGKIEPFKMPKEFVRVNEIPRISISKIDRLKLLEIYREATSH